MSGSTGRWLATVAVAGMTALGAVGCSDDDGDDGQTAAPEDLTVPEASCAPLEENLRTLQGFVNGDVDGEQAQAALVQVRAIVGGDAPGLAEVNLAVSALAEAGEEERAGVVDTIAPGFEQAIDDLQGVVERSCPAGE